MKKTTNSAFRIPHSALRKGFTTGTCAQAASKAAVFMLVNKSLIEKVTVETPKGVRLDINIIDQKIEKDFAECSVIKDSGDDPDVTNGIKIFARVKYSDKKGISIRGSEGVGIVTRPGLAVSVGEYAINPIPRQMIIKEIDKIMRNAECGVRNGEKIMRNVECGVRNDEKNGNSEFRIPNSVFKGIEVIISIPEGKEIAKQTFNARLGIEGGISVIGTTGIVEPRSTDAYKKTLSLQLDVLKAAGYRKAVLILGYVGENFCEGKPEFKPDSIVKIGDYAGFMLSECVKKEIEGVLLIGHISKMVKIANGQFDTNIRCGDHRIETIVRYAKMCGAQNAAIKDISEQISAEACIDILKKNNLTAVFDMIAKEIVAKVNKMINNQLLINCMVLSLKGELLSEMRNAECGMEKR